MTDEDRSLREIDIRGLSVSEIDKIKFRYKGQNLVRTVHDT